MLGLLPQVEASAWSEFGLAGLVIGALFTGLFFMAKWIGSFVSKMAEIHLKERDEWRLWGNKQLELHRTEREDWRTQIEADHKQNREAIDRLAESVAKNS